MFEMTAINNGTRIRTDHNVFAPVITSVNANVTVQGDEVWTAPADGNEVKQGDKWLHTTKPAVGWMAFTHKGVAICKDLHETTVEPPVTADYVVNVGIGSMGINSVTIDGDETKPLIVLINSKVIWP